MAGNLQDHLRWDTVKIGRKTFALCEVLPARGTLAACWRALGPANELVLIGLDGRLIRPAKPAKKRISWPGVIRWVVILGLLGGGFWLGRRWLPQWFHEQNQEKIKGMNYVTDRSDKLPGADRQKQLEEFFERYTQAINTNETSDDLALLLFSQATKKKAWEANLTKFNATWPIRDYKKPATLVLKGSLATCELPFQRENAMSKSEGAVKVQLDLTEKEGRLLVRSVERLAESERSVSHAMTEATVKRFVRAFVNACGSDHPLGPASFYAAEASHQDGLLTEEQFTEVMRSQTLPMVSRESMEARWQDEQKRWPRRTLEILADSSIGLDDKDKIELKQIDDSTIRVRCAILETRENPRTGRKEKLKYWNRLRVHRGAQALEITSHLRIR